MARKLWKRGDPIGYIGDEVPKFDFSPFEGEQYERMVPDTLDVDERAELAIHFLTNVVNPDADYEIYFSVALNCNPAVMWHDQSGAYIQPKFMEALPLLRSITGNSSNLIVDREWAKAMLRSQGEDGIIYSPVIGRPWARYGNGPGWDVGDDGGDQLGSLYVNGILIAVMGLYYQQTGDEMWKNQMRRLVDGFAKLMVYKDDYAYNPIFSTYPEASISPDSPILDPNCELEAGGTVSGWWVQSLTQAYHATGYEPALDLAGKLAVYLMKHSGSYDDQARFLGMPHTHHHLKPLIGLLEYGLTAGNEEMIEFARKGYEYARSCGAPSIGYYPGIPGPDVTYDYSTVQEFSSGIAEGCSEGDFVAIAAKLCESGVADYWDDLDRCVRNHFFESQMLTSDWVAEMTKDFPPPVSTEDWDHPSGWAVANPSATAERVAERHIGTFASWGVPNDIWDGDGKGFMHCCAGNETRAIYYLWENILNFDGGKLRVNLLLNRASPWADVDSHIPYQGRVDLTIKQPCDVEVRIPEWVQPGQATASKNGEAVQLGWNGRYAQAGAANPGDVVTVRFPIFERTVTEKINGTEFNMIIRGNDVVQMSPPGKYYPFYQRKGHYREDETRWVKRRRFVSSPLLHWR